MITEVFAACMTFVAGQAGLDDAATIPISAYPEVREVDRSEMFGRGHYSRLNNLVRVEWRNTWRHPHLFEGLVCHEAAHFVVDELAIPVHNACNEVIAYAIHLEYVRLHWPEIVRDIGILEAIEARTEIEGFADYWAEGCRTVLSSPRWPPRQNRIW